MTEIVVPVESFLAGMYIKNIPFKSMITDQRLSQQLDVGDTLAVVSKIDDLKIFKDLVYSKTHPPLFHINFVLFAH